MIIQIKNNNKTFALAKHLLLVEGKDKSGAQIVIPPSFVGPLLSHVHLIGHLGLTCMLANLRFYFFVKKYTLTRQFVSCYYSCFLSQTGSRRAKLGMYPAHQCLLCFWFRK
jgi:hypothetical protein